jgi:broad specificity phosphatase PhoE
VRGQWQTLSQELIEQTVANIRQIRRDEIPADHYVSLDLNRPVTWAKLLAGG